VSLSAAVIDALLLSGATREQIAAAMKADIAERHAIEAARLEAQKEGNRTRQQRKRERDNAASRDVTEVTRDARDTPRGSPKENNQTPSLPPAEVSEPDGSSPQPRPWSLPAGVSLQVWTDFKKNRAKKRLPNTDTAWKGFQDDLARVSLQTGIPPPKLIERCTAKGWGAIYDPTEQDSGRSTNSLGRNQPSGDGLSSTARAAIAVFGPD
jgi:hypothetical protein